MESGHNASAGGHAKPYIRLLVMAALSFAAMYALMYAMVDKASSIYPSLNQLYMAALMAAPMVVIELALMGGMYSNKRINLAIVAASAAVFVGAFFFIRQQVGVSDEEFLRSMIPHHSGAILMCERATIRDAEVADLCRTIVAGQQAEIDQMKSVLRRLD